jgi:hypothetical protein
VGVWGNLPIAHRVPGQSDPEIDPYAWYTVSLTDALNVQPGLTVYTYARAPLDQGFFRTTFEPSLAVNCTVQGVRLTPKLYYDTVRDGATYECTATAAVPLPDWGTELDFTAVAGTFAQRNAVNGATPRVKNWGHYWLLGVSAPFAIARAAKLTMGFACTGGGDNYLKQGSAPKAKDPAAVRRGVFSISCAWTY